MKAWWQGLYGPRAYANVPLPLLFLCMIHADPSFLPTRCELVWRGIKGRCPACTKGRLFCGYLKPIPRCDFCGEDFSAFKADDGPAWLSILLTGHLLLPVAIGLAMSTLPPWAGLLILLLMTIAAVLIILPRAKGVFIAILWFLKRKKSLERGTGI